MKADAMKSLDAWLAEAQQSPVAAKGYTSRELRKAWGTGEGKTGKLLRGLIESGKWGHLGKRDEKQINGTIRGRDIYGPVK